MFLGILAGILACALWGFTYSVPSLLSDYSVLHLGLIRIVILGVFSTLLLTTAIKELKKLQLKDWIFLLKLTLIGNFINFIASLYCSAWAGASVSGLTTGAIPVLIAIVSNSRDKKKGKPFLPFSKLIIPLIFICIGFIVCNFSEFENFGKQQDSLKFFIGVFLGLSHTLMWTWYPIANADWLQDHEDFNSATWATLQLAVLLPFALVGLGIEAMISGSSYSFLGQRPLFFFTLLFFNGLFCCWGAMGLWNYMSKKIPTALAGQLMVLETIFAIIIGLILRREMPSLDLIIGVVILTVGVSIALKLFEKHATKQQKVSV